MEVVWSDLALTQLDEVIDYVEEHFGLLTSQKVLHNILEKTDELAQYSTHGIYDARYTSWVSGQDMVIRHLLLAPNRVYYLIDGEQVVIMGIVHVKCYFPVIVNYNRTYIQTVRRNRGDGDGVAMRNNNRTADA